MPRVCKICTHSQVQEIDRAIARGKAYRDIAGQFQVSKTTVERHVKRCIPAALEAIREKQTTERGIIVENEVRIVFERMKKVMDACDEWLTDPEDRQAYTIEPRSNEVDVIYLDHSDLTESGRPKRKREQLSILLAQLVEGKAEAVSVRTRHADPRELVIKAAAEVRGQMELYGRLLGVFQRDRENETDLARAEERRKFAEEKLREVMAALGLDEQSARRWMMENTPAAAKWLM